MSVSSREPLCLHLQWNVKHALELGMLSDCVTSDPISVLLTVAERIRWLIKRKQMCAANISHPGVAFFPQLHHDSSLQKLHDSPRMRLAQPSAGLAFMWPAGKSRKTSPLAMLAGRRVLSTQNTGTATHHGSPSR